MRVPLGTEVLPGVSSTASRFGSTQERVVIALLPTTEAVIVVVPAVRHCARPATIVATAPFDELQSGSPCGVGPETTVTVNITDSPSARDGAAGSRART